MLILFPRKTGGEIDDLMPGGGSDEIPDAGQRVERVNTITVFSLFNVRLLPLLF